MIKAGAFGRKYFFYLEEIFILVLMVDGIEFNDLKNVDSKCYCWGYDDVSVNKYDVSC